MSGRAKDHREAQDAVLESETSCQLGILVPVREVPYKGRNPLGELVGN